jgi:hypothetical protein
MSLRNKLMISGACLMMALSLQGCGAWEYAFGGPEVSDMNEVIMKTPATQPALLNPNAVRTSDPNAVTSQTATQYPTPWTTGQLIDHP